MCAATSPEVSIVIPVLDPQPSLARCLRALARQSYPAERFEVIVVDNGPVPSVALAAEGLRAARVVHEPKAGLYAARNRGMADARGAILGFTDADCVPADDWIECGVKAVRRLERPGLVGGRIEIAVRDPQRPTPAELYETVLGFPQEAYVAAGFSTTANLFTTVRAVDRIGPFDERLFSGGDVDWGRRAGRASVPVLYAPDVRVSHDARRTARELYRKAVRVAGGVQGLADLEGRGLSGCARDAFSALVLLRTVRRHWADPQLNTMSRKLAFARLVWTIELLRAIERYRVHFGKPPRRV